MSEPAVQSATLAKPNRPATALLLPDITELIAARAYRELRDALRDLDPHDIAGLIEELDAEQAVVAMRVLPKAASADAFTDLDTTTQEALITALGEERSTRLVEEMDPDDRAALLEELPAPIAQRVLQRLTPESRRVTRMILGYPEESVGRLITPDYVKLREPWTVAQSLDHIREFGRDAETLHWVYVVDDQSRLVSEIHIRRILLAEPDDRVADLQAGPAISLHASDDQEEAVRRMADYDRSVLPVVDAQGVLVGIVTHDDIADIAEAEATEDIQKLGGLEALDDPYMDTPLHLMLKKRGGWLIALLAAQALAIWVMSSFERTLAEVAVLALFIPMIISSGGNTGTQAASLLIRALALREVEPADWRRVLLKELATGICLGAALALVAFAIAHALHTTGMITTTTPTTVAAAVGISIAAIVLWGALLGSLFPLLLERLRLDPAAISSPLVATIMDVTGLAIYFAVASLILSV